MIFSLTDETYSVFCGMPESESSGVMLRVALYDQLYWIAGSVIGAALAQGLPFDLTGIDFSMTALFVVICVEKALKAKNRTRCSSAEAARWRCSFCWGRARSSRPRWH